MKDKLGNEMQVGDLVTYASLCGKSAEIGAGYVVRFTANNVVTKNIDEAKIFERRHRPNKCLVIQLAWFSPEQIVRMKNA